MTMELTRLSKMVDKRLAKLDSASEEGSDKEKYRGYSIEKVGDRFDVIKGKEKMGDAPSLEGAKEMCDKLEGTLEETKKAFAVPVV